MAKRKVEKRIRVLGGQDDSVSKPLCCVSSYLMSRQQVSLYQDSSIASRLSLRDILTNPSSRSYFMEFMDRRNRSLLVQFWLTVESFKNPLESVDSDSSDDDDEALRDPSLSATLKEDISMMNELYFSGSTPDPTL